MHREVDHRGIHLGDEHRETENEQDDAAIGGCSMGVGHGIGIEWRCRHRRGACIVTLRRRPKHGLRAALTIALQQAAKPETHHDPRHRHRPHRRAGGRTRARQHAAGVGRWPGAACGRIGGLCRGERGHRQRASRRAARGGSAGGEAAGPPPLLPAGLGAGGGAAGIVDAGGGAEPGARGKLARRSAAAGRAHLLQPPRRTTGGFDLRCADRA